MKVMCGVFSLGSCCEKTRQLHGWGWEVGVGNKEDKINRNYLVHASGPFVASLFSYVLMCCVASWRSQGSVEEDAEPAGRGWLP